MLPIKYIDHDIKSRVVIDILFSIVRIVYLYKK